MNRPIKFRGRHVVTGEWFYGNLLAPNIIRTVEQNDRHDGQGLRPELAEFCVVDPETVGQSTCRIDRNNNEIYEDDIIKYFVTGDGDGGVLVVLSGTARLPHLSHS